VNWEVINSDCLVAMRGFAPGSFDAVPDAFNFFVSELSKSWLGDYITT
jgi:hypothetical protein